MELSRKLKNIPIGRRDDYIKHYWSNHTRYDDVGAMIKSIYSSIKQVVVNFFLNKWVFTTAVFCVASFVVITIGYFSDFYTEKNWENILVEAHGFLIEFFVFGLLLLYIQQRDDKWGKKIKAYRRLDQFLFLYRTNKSGYITSQIHQTISVLNELGETQFDWTGIQVVNQSFFRLDLTTSEFHSTDFSGSDFYGTDLSFTQFVNAKVIGTSFVKADFFEANLERTFFVNCDFRKVTNLTLEQLEQVDTVHGSKFDDDLYNKIKKCLPNKLDKPNHDWGTAIINLDQAYSIEKGFTHENSLISDTDYY